MTATDSQTWEGRRSLFVRCPTRAGSPNTTRGDSQRGRTSLSFRSLSAGVAAPNVGRVGSWSSPAAHSPEPEPGTTTANPRRQGQSADLPERARGISVSILSPVRSPYTTKGVEAIRRQPKRSESIYQIQEETTETGAKRGQTEPEYRRRNDETGGTR